MILINYWTNEWFEDRVWDKYYCKSFKSAKKYLKDLLRIREEDIADCEEVMNGFYKFEYNYRACNKFTKNITCPSGELYINLEYIELI